MSHRQSRTQRSRVSFGSVATVQYDVSLQSAQSLISSSPKKMSVEDFENVRYSFNHHPRQASHGRRDQDAAFEERSNRIDDLLLRIEQTMNAAEAAIRGDDKNDGVDLTLIAQKMIPAPRRVTTPRTHVSVQHQNHHPSKVDGGRIENAFFDFPCPCPPPRPPVRVLSR